MAVKLDASWSEERRTSPYSFNRSSSESGTRAAVREFPPLGAAMRFLEDSAPGWSSAELVRWCRGELLARGWLVPDRPMSGIFRVQEATVGLIELPTSPYEYPFRGTTSLATRIVEVARGRAIDELRLLATSHHDDRFVREALYRGRVERRSARNGQNGQSVWTPVLREGESLSEWVLALFAADALRDRETYERSLYVCEICTAVGFDESGRRDACPAHRPAPATVPPLPLPSDALTPREPPFGKTG